MRTLSPVPPDQFLQLVDGDVERVVVFHRDIALSKIFAIHSPRVPRAGCQEQRYNHDWPVCGLWNGGGCVCRGADGLCVCAI